MTDSPSEPAQEVAAGDAAPGSSDDGGGAAAFAEHLAAVVGATAWHAEHETVRLEVPRERWLDALRAARDDADLPFFSWLSAIDWSREVAVGEPVADSAALSERYEVMARLSSIRDATGAHFVATVPKDDPWIDSIVPLFAGAAWHEREAAEMFGIDFRGHPNLVKLYLPDSFEGFPLRKSYPLLAREVKPWPGMVDVEAMPGEESDAGPTTENVEAGDE